MVRHFVEGLGGKRNCLTNMRKASINTVMKDERTDRRNITCPLSLWDDFTEACRVAGIPRSRFLQAAMKSFVNMNKKPFTEVAEEIMNDLLEHDKDIQEAKRLMDIGRKTEAEKKKKKRVAK